MGVPTMSGDGAEMDFWRIPLRPVGGLDVRSDPEGLQGLQVWPASGALLEWLKTEDAPSLVGQTILELGSGCGELAMELVLSFGATRVIATDGDKDALANLGANLARNRLGGSVKPCLWDWQLDPAPEVDLSGVATIIGTDVVYVGTGAEDLARSLAGLLPGRTAWLMLCDRPRGGEQFLLHHEDGTRSPLERFEGACVANGLAVSRICTTASRAGLAGPLVLFRLTSVAAPAAA